MALLYLPLVALIFYWRLKVFKESNISKGKAIVLYSAYALAPLTLYASIFAILVGIESLTDIALIGEGYARTLPIILAGGIAVLLITTIVFSIVVQAVKKT